MLDDPIDKAMVEAINDIGHVMGKKRLPEFVENKEVLDALTRNWRRLCSGVWRLESRCLSVPAG